MITYNDFIDFLRDNGVTDAGIAVVLTAIEQDYSDYLEALEEYGYEEADRETYQEALEAFFTDYEPVYESENYYTCNGYEFYCFDDFDKAVVVAEEQLKYILEDLGYDSIHGWEDYVDEEWFEDTMLEMEEVYASDIADEGSREYSSRLVEECVERGLIDDSDFNEDENGEIDYTDCRVDEYKLQEMLAQDMYDDNMRYYNSASAWYLADFGEESFNTVVENNELIDLDGLAAYVVRSDGPENTLASYDGEEVRQDVDGVTWILYRAN